MSKPLISVLMSVHNGQAFLNEAVQSILNQTYGDLELLVVDDASTDNSLQSLRSFSDPRLHTITLNKNVGLAEALNLALAKATGDLIARMDADDVSEIDRFARQVEFLEEHPEVVLVGSSYTLIDDQGLEFGSQSVLTENEEIQGRLLEDSQFCHPSVMMRSSVLKAVGGYRNIGGRFAQDYDLWLRIAERGEVMNLEQALLRYRVHESQVSINKLAMQARTAELYRILALQRRRNGCEDLAAAEAILESKSTEIRARVAANMLHWSRIFEEQHRGSQARALHWRAIRTSPFSPAVREFISSAVSRRLRKLIKLN